MPATTALGDPILASRAAVKEQYAQPQVIGDDAHGPLHVGWWSDPRTPLAQAQRAYEDRLLAPLALRSGQRVLDAGCGFGSLALRLADQGLRATGIDLVPHHIRVASERARSLGLPADFHCADLRELPFLSDSFDTVIALEVLLHCPDRDAVLAELARILKPGGRLVISDYVVTGGGFSRSIAQTATGAAHLGHPDDYVQRLSAAGVPLDDRRDVTEHTIDAYYAWSAALGHAPLRRLIAQTTPWATPLVPAATHFMRWSLGRGGWGLHWFWARKATPLTP